MLFDAAHADALGKMKIPEDRLFLEDQRRVRKMIILLVQKTRNLRQSKSALNSVE